MKRLRITDFSMTDAGLLSVAKHHNRLRYFSLHGYRSVTVAGVYAFMQQEPYLEELNTAFPYRVYAAKEPEWKKACPRLYQFNGTAIGTPIARLGNAPPMIPYRYITS